MWLLSLWANPLTRKIIIYAGITVAIFFALRWYSNRAYYQGMQEGRTAVTTEIEKARAAEWKVKADQLAAEATKIDAARQTVDAERDELARDRSIIKDALSRSLNEITLTQGVNNAKVDAVPATELDSALRAQSAKLATAVGK